MRFEKHCWVIVYDFVIADVEERDVLADAWPARISAHELVGSVVELEREAG